MAYPFSMNSPTMLAICMLLSSTKLHTKVEASVLCAYYVWNSV
jgi:hypothetical protein